MANVRSNSHFGQDGYKILQYKGENRPPKNQVNYFAKKRMESAERLYEQKLKEAKFKRTNPRSSKTIVPQGGGRAINGMQGDFR